MCVDNDSRPPITPIAGGSAGGKDLKLTSSDGTKFMAYAARAARPTGAGMVVIPDVRGLHVYYKELADRFAEVGVAAGAAYLHGKDGGQVRSLFSVGFCFGGALSYLQAASDLGYAGVIGFYGWALRLKRLPRPPQPLDAASRYKAPVQSIFGGADEGIPQADVDQFDTALKKASVKHDMKVYPGAPHSFFDRKFTEFAEASADAWKRVQAFVTANTRR